jgi:hypothetical protein
MNDHTFEVEGLTITVSPRPDGLVFVYLDTDTDETANALRVRINEATLAAERSVATTYRITDLDGTADQADWLHPGHVLDDQETEWLRNLHIVGP